MIYKYARALPYQKVQKLAAVYSLQELYRNQTISIHLIDIWPAYLASKHDGDVGIGLKN